MKATWNQIRNILQQSLNPGLFKIWITPLHAEISDETCRLIAPNEFVAAGVREKLLDAITEAAVNVLGVSARVEVATQAVEGRKRPPMALPKPIPSPASPRAHGAKSHVWRFTFDDFVVGPSNELAFAASQGVCSDTLLSDQLFISSGPGLGKTHLLQAIGNALSCSSNKSDPRVRYVTAEDFATRMVVAIKMREMDRFKSEFRENTDILLVEDIHFLQNKEKIQDEFLGTLKALREHGSKVVFTSSFLPRELMNVDKQLASRFCSGFLAVIEKPDMETCMRIIRRKARGKFQVDVPEEVTQVMAERLHSDIRQLESCLNNLILKARLLNRAISLELALDVLGNFATATPRASLESIVKTVCEGFEIPNKQLSSKSRKRQIVIARNTAFFLARKHTDLSLKEIGERFNRKHSTVLKGITNLEREISSKTPLGRQIERTIEMFDL